jgi:hypothetical protein
LGAVRPGGGGWNVFTKGGRVWTYDGSVKVVQTTPEIEKMAKDVSNMYIHKVYADIKPKTPKPKTPAPKKKMTVADIKAKHAKHAKR